MPTHRIVPSSSPCKVSELEKSRTHKSEISRQRPQATVQTSFLYFEASKKKESDTTVLLGQARLLYTVRKAIQISAIYSNMKCWGKHDTTLNIPRGIAFSPLYFTYVISRKVDFLFPLGHCITTTKRLLTAPLHTKNFL